MGYHRVIFRIDYEPCFEMFDSVGQTIRLLLEEQLNQEKFLPELLESKTGHGVAARFVDPEKTEMRILTIEPAAIHGSFEIVDGVSRSNIIEYGIFRKLIKIVNNARKKYNINLLNRSGIRLFYLGDFMNEDGLFLEKFNKLFDPNLLEKFRANLGNIKDTGIAIDGVNEDGTNYHCKIGPYQAKEAEKYFPAIKGTMADVQTKCFIADIDIYENGFNLDKKVSFAKWCNPAIIKANDIMEEIKSSIAELDN